ncbi:MAG: hypothetical protein U5K69_08745 [Balneolaceae bacterium]|nr:hypothetical protein [Balneolaceae bacterium]
MVNIESETVQYGDEILFHFENTTEDTVVVLTTGCGTKSENFLPSFVIEKRKNLEWIEAGAPNCIAIATPPMKLAPGGSESVQVPADLGLEKSTIPGSFRYVFDIRYLRKGGYPVDTRLPMEQRISPAFRIMGE